VNSETDADVAELWQEVRSGWLAEPAILVEQISFLMMLKRLGRSGSSPPSDWEGPVLWWEDLRLLSGLDLVETLKEYLVPFVTSAMPRSIRPTMREARFALDDPFHLTLCMDSIARLGAAQEGPFFDALLSRLAEGDGRQVRTPPAVAAAMVDLARPVNGGRICDPAVGTGGLLLEAARQLGATHGAGGLELRGYDIDPSKARLATFNLLFHDVPGASVAQADVLSSAFAQPGRFDVVLCAPPFGGQRSESEIDEHLSKAGRRTELLYLERCRQLQRGKAAILIPEAVLFGRSLAYAKAREELLQKTQVDGVVLLPPGVLGFTNIRSAILVISGKGVTRDVWYCPIAEGSRSSVDEQLGFVAEALRATRQGVPHMSMGAAALTRTMFNASLDEIQANDWSLAPALYRKAEISESEEDPIRLLDSVRAMESEIDFHLTEARRLLAENE